MSTPSLTFATSGTPWLSAGNDGWMRPALVTSRPNRSCTRLPTGLAAVHFRKQALLAVTAIRAHPRVEVVPASTALLDAALDLYQQRPDKDWGLTDGASFVVMADPG